MNQCMTDKGKRNIEKRLLKRKQLLFYLKVYDRKTGSLLGHLADISLEGLMLFSNTRVELNKVYQMEIELGDDMAFNENLFISATSLWGETDANPDYFITGFRFTEVDQNTLEMIDTLIDSYGFMG